MNGAILAVEAGATGMDWSALTSALSLSAFQSVIQAALPVVGVAVLCGFLFYVVRWAIGLFRGI